MRIKTSVNKQGQIYVPTKVRKEIGIPINEEKEVVLIGDMRVFLVVPSGLSSKEALESLEVISKHLEHGVKVEEEEEEQVESNTS